VLLQVQDLPARIADLKELAAAEAAESFVATAQWVLSSAIRSVQLSHCSYY